MAGSVSCEIFSTGRVNLNSVKTQADEEVEMVVKPILKHIAGSIREAHFRSISDYGVRVILSDSPNDICIRDGSLCMVTQLDSSVPFKIKYTRLDQAFDEGKFDSVSGLKPQYKHLKSGHGRLVKWHNFSVTIYHSGNIEARTFKPDLLTRMELQRALLRVCDTLMSIRSIIELQIGDTWDGSKRTHPYREQRTHHTRAREPDSAPFQEQPPLAAAHAASASLPSGWVEQMDPSSNRPYYMNTATGHSVWERPAGVNSAAATYHNVLQQPSLHVFSAGPTTRRPLLQTQIISSPVISSHRL